MTMNRTLALATALLATSALAAEAAGLTWTVPEAWKAQPERPMRVATYGIPAVKGDPEAAELGVFYFGQGSGGSVDANIARWIAQFSQPDGSASDKVAKRQSRKVNGLPVTQVEVSGTFLGGGRMMGPAPDKHGYALLGAIVEGPQGAVFFKLTGPKKTVAAAKQDFQKLVGSLKTK